MAMKAMAVCAAVAAVLSVAAAEPDAALRRSETARIQGLIDAAAAKGGGRVVIAKGEHSCGTLYLKSGVELHLEEGAALSGGGRPDDYDDAIPVDEVYSYEGCHANTTTRKAFIFAWNAHDIAITGKGVIDGHGPEFFVRKGTVWAKPNCMRTRLVVFMNCRGIRLEDATFKDSPAWTMWLRHCEDIAVSRIRVVAEQRMINSDGIDFDACRHVRVGDSYFKTGDDCLVLRAIRHASDRGHEVVTEDVVVSNCVLNSTCQGVRIGCPSDDTVRNAVFRDITFTGRNAISSEQPPWYLESKDGGYFRCGGILFENWKIDCQVHPVIVAVYKGVKLRDFGHITFRNLDVKSGKPFKIVGTSETPVREIRFENVRGKVASECPFEIKNASGLSLDGIMLNF